MSVQSEINRISGNVTAALAALAEKGVEVPAGSNSDALAGLIGAIEAGGGGVEIETGTFVPAEQSSVQYIYYSKTHDTPATAMIVFAIPSASTTQSSYASAVFMSGDASIRNINMYTSSKSYTPYAHLDLYFPSYSEVGRFMVPAGGSGKKLQVGVEHMWLAIWGDPLAGANPSSSSGSGN